MTARRTASKTGPDVGATTNDDRPAVAEIDVRGIACPLAWAKAKVHLETFRRGTIVDVLTDDPRSVRDLPRAAEANGHHVILVDTHDASARIRLEV